MTEAQWIERLAAAARRFLAAYDEFWPEYPGAIGDDLQALIGAVEEYPEEALTPEPWDAARHIRQCLMSPLR